MIICSNCFTDTEIKNRIESYNVQGTCQFCRDSKYPIYNTDTDNYLNGVFDKIISLYTPLSSIDGDKPVSKQTFMKNEFSKNWDIFNNLTEEQIYEIVTALSPDMYSESPDLFDSPVVNTLLNDNASLLDNSILRGHDWGDFVQALKHQNRFHTSYMNTEILKVFCSYIRKPYKKGARFYRGRISSPEGFSYDEMSAPPEQKVSDGRANSMGIRRLYLANDYLTTIYETRAGAFDYVTVGCFELQCDITVVDFKLINQISPITEGLDVLRYIINKEHLNKINNEMGKAMRRSDSPLDYIPTQYVTDFIQSITHDDIPEYDGIEYKSTLHPSGFNLAIFNPDLFSCISTDIYKVNELKYEPLKI